MLRRPAEVLRQEFPAGGESVDFDPAEFDRQIDSHGVPVVHWRAMACPEGVVNKDDATRHSHHDHAGCSNGYLYHRAGTLTALFSGNSERNQFLDAGSVDGSTAQVTLRRHYDDGQPAYLSYADRLYLADSRVLWPHWELTQYSGTGKDRLRFPARHVNQLVDNRMVAYAEGVDFALTQGGLVQWLKGGPGYDMETGDPAAGDSARGRVYSVHYLYQPYWYVQSIGHALRVVEVHDADGNPRTERMPFQATIVRENVFEDRERQQEATSRESMRDEPSAPDGSLGPR